jgi:hypothetical protein
MEVAGFTPLPLILIGGILLLIAVGLTAAVIRGRDRR